MSERQATYRYRAPKTPRISEHQEQASFFDEAHYRYQHREDFFQRLLFAVPNGMWLGGKNPYALMNKFKAEGLKPGTSDIIYLQARGEYSCLAIEMKAQDKRNSADAVTPEQSAFLADVNESGGWGEVCYGADEALSILEKYMSMEAK